MIAESHSSSELLTSLLAGVVRKGVALDGRRLLFGDYVVLLTPPGAARMPNGVECRARIAAGSRVSIGRGRLSAGHLEILPGPAWNPTPVFERLDVLPWGPEPNRGAMGAWIAPTGVEYALLAGYLVGLSLLHGERRRADLIAERAAGDAQPLEATVLRHAARGEVPEPVHVLLCSGDPGRLIAFAPAGMAWLRGLVSAGLPLGVAATAVSVRRR